MNIVVVNGSNRDGSQSLKVSHWLEQHAQKLGQTSSVLDLHTLNLPLYDDAEHAEHASTVASLKSQLANADAVVFVSPEWNGMASVALFNMLHYIEHELAYKPVMLVGVSAGRGGTHPVDQMKIMGQKNRHYILSPENLIVSGVEQVFNSSEIHESEPDFALKQRADYSLRVLVELAVACVQVRASGVVDLDRFANGV